MVVGRNRVAASLPHWHRGAVGCALGADDAARHIDKRVGALLDDAEEPSALRGALHALVESVDERERRDKASQTSQLEVCARALGTSLGS